MLAGSTQAFILDYILHLGKWRVCYSCPRAVFSVRPPSRKKEKSSPQTSLLNIITPIIQIPHVPLVWRRGRSGKRECSHETDLPVRVKGWEGKDPFALHWASWKLCSDHECLKSQVLRCITVFLWKHTCSVSKPYQNSLRDHILTTNITYSLHACHRLNTTNNYHAITVFLDGNTMVYLDNMHYGTMKCTMVELWYSRKSYMKTMVWISVVYFKVP